tara:strand:- start:2885 stop:3775 length:891 start_codon:yes stop_codon:yes gene_type:complete
MKREANKIASNISSSITFYNQYIFQVTVLLLLVVLTNKNDLNHDIIYNISFIAIIIISCYDYFKWKKIENTLLFTLLMTLYLLYFKNNDNSIRQWLSKINAVKVSNTCKSNYETNEKFENIDKILLDTNVLDYIPDNYKTVKPKNNYNAIEPNINQTLGGLPKVDYTLSPNGIYQQAIIDALDDRHKLPDLLYKIENEGNNDSNDKNLGKKYRSLKADGWNINRYYPNCKYDKMTRGFKDKTIQYCSNLPKTSKKQLKMINDNNVKLLFPKHEFISELNNDYRFDIGGKGIVKNNN